MLIFRLEDARMDTMVLNLCQIAILGINVLGYFVLSYFGIGVHSIWVRAGSIGKAQKKPSSCGENLERKLNECLDLSPMLLGTTYLHCLK